MICDRCKEPLSEKREAAINFLRQHGVPIPFPRCVPCQEAIEDGLTVNVGDAVIPPPELDGDQLTTSMLTHAGSGVMVRI